MDSEFKKVGDTPFLIALSSESEEKPGRRIGTISMADKSDQFRSLVSLLSSIELADWVFRQHYLRTVSDLGNPKLAEAEGISGMIEELLSLRDRAQSDDVPYGVLLFLGRLCQEAGLAAKIEPWIRANAAHQGNCAGECEAEARRRIRREAAHRRGDGRRTRPDQRVSALPAHQHAPHRTGCEISVAKGQGLAGFRGKTPIARPEPAESRRNPVLPDPGCGRHSALRPAISQRADQWQVHARPGVCRDRAESGARFGRGIRESASLWLRYADAIRCIKPGEVKFIRIPAPDPAGPALPSEKGFCYAGFTVRPAAGGGGGGGCAGDRFGELMRLGVPYLYWLHDGPSADVAKVEPTLTAWLGQLPTLDRLPATFMEERIRGDAYARQASLLWDDPQFNPFSMPDEA